ncbi:hypothetical protein [Lactococcus lactis]|uniref:Uncharacterized protein n=1 Tax=Lactococcus lactis TaxID=1358 RepID=A0A3S3L961_9LACT|nr:hypothetical protein [Lactococcus lactis]KSU30420.1 hypothetical protein NCDO895_0452 [Lactococcus lactis subsp. lactis]MCT3086034.1 hypothetical protein [Lactococcus lactis]MCT3123956.1 hypothetical protein [Lactococcus lactis]NYZ58397.1 hypothetical protein [Lactococcus lactis]RWR48061.1 hypothetical protein EO246_04095 [Lactococcus lactis]
MEYKIFNDKQLEGIALKMGIANELYQKRRREILQSGELAYDSDIKRLRRGYIDTSIRKYFQEGGTGLDFVVNIQNVGFNNKFFEFAGLTTYGDTVVILKKRDTLVNGFEKENTVHLMEYAKKNMLLSEEDPLNLFYDLDKLEGKSDELNSEGEFVFVTIGYDIDPITDNFSHLGIYTLDKENGKVRELQDFSKYIVELFHPMDSGITGTDQTPPPTNDYGLEVRKQSKENDGF